MREVKPKRSHRAAARRAKPSSAPPASSHAEELMELAVDAAQSRHLPDFLNRFAERSAHMLNAVWAGVAVFRGRETEMYASHSAKQAATQPAEDWVITAALEKREEVEIRALSANSPTSFSGHGKAVAAIFVPIAASDGERLGTLCLLSERKTLTDDEKRLLHALASHAALSLENFRRFSQLERSKRQWVEDIDAISDYIVVHDRTWNIVRTNRSLASHLGVPPVALVGEEMSTLRRSEERRVGKECRSRW